MRGPIDEPHVSRLSDKGRDLFVCLGEDRKSEGWRTGRKEKLETV